MRKILLPPLMILLLVACADRHPVASVSGPGVRLEASVGSDFTAATSHGRVLPAAYTAAMGETNNSWPHARANMRYQQVFLGAELGDLDRIAGLCLRHDE
ncbi:MAG TPA: hypothetical protein VGC52_02715, partial [Gemmatimonadaceae bacterium]